MKFSSKWYKAAGISIVAGAVTARYVAKWRHSRSLRRESESPNSLFRDKYFIGIDLTDLLRPEPPPCDVAVLNPDFECSFSKWEYNETGSGIVPVSALGRSFILSIDGPQGLAGFKNANMRTSEREVGAPGHSGYSLPPKNKPYGGFIAGSVNLFHQLVTSGSRFRLLGMDGVALHEANLLEVFPGGAWKVLAGNRRLPRKETAKGREMRQAILEGKGIKFSEPGPLTTDQLDAALAAFTGLCFYQGLAVTLGTSPWMDHTRDVIREGYIVEPRLVS